MVLYILKKLPIYAVAALGVAVLNACSSSSPNDPPATGVGSTGPGGGIVFETFDDTDSTGLEVFRDTIGQSAWGCEGIVVDAGVEGRASNGIDVPSGAASSELLRTASSSGVCVAPAAELTFGFTNNGFTDWYLPSTDELMMIRDLGFLPGVGGDGYWSSTEDSDENAFTVFIESTANPLDNGDPSTSDKLDIANVVTIRRFQR